MVLTATATKSTSGSRGHFEPTATGATRHEKLRQPSATEPTAQEIILLTLLVLSRARKLTCRFSRIRLALGLVMGTRQTPVSLATMMMARRFLNTSEATDMQQ